VTVAVSFLWSVTEQKDLADGACEVDASMLLSFEKIVGFVYVVF